MSRMDCDIVKDLVPSYLDGICSERSRQAVEEHIADCGTCREYVQKLKQTEIVGSGVAHREVDYMKKVRRHFLKEHSVNFIWILVVLAVVCAGAAWFRVDMGSVNDGILQILPPAVAACLIFLMKGEREPLKWNRRRIAAGVLSLAMSCYGGSLSLLIVRWMNMGTMPFGMEASRSGPFICCQLFVIIILQLGLFIWSLRDSLKKECGCGLLSVLSLVGIFYGVAHERMLFHMDTFEVFMGTYGRITLVFALEAVLLGVLAVAVSGRSANR